MEIRRVINSLNFSSSKLHFSKKAISCQTAVKTSLYISQTP